MKKKKNYKKYNSSSSPVFGDVLSDCAVRKANLCAN